MSQPFMPAMGTPLKLAGGRGAGCPHLLEIIIDKLEREIDKALSRAFDYGFIIGAIVGILLGAAITYAVIHG